MLELADVGEAFVVAVVVHEGDAGGFRGGRLYLRLRAHRSAHAGRH